MTIAQLNEQDLQRRLHENRLFLHMGPFLLRLGSRDPTFIRALQLLHPDTPLLEDPTSQLIDFHIEVQPGKGVRRWWRPQIRFETDATPPFEPFPRDHGFPLFEWGLNWCIAIQAHQYLMFHSAVLAKDGRALIMPAEPGSGKSTLCAALMLRGWQLLSDEFGLYRPESRMIEPIPRPIPLKNESIEVIRAFSQDAVLGPIYEKTRKGDVAHLRPTHESMQLIEQPALPAWVVFPQYRKGAQEKLHPFAQGRAFLKLSGNAFNYRLQGARGFDAVVDIVNSCDHYYLEFSDLTRAVEILNTLPDTPIDPSK